MLIARGTLQCALYKAISKYNKGKDLQDFRFLNLRVLHRQKIHQTTKNCVCHPFNTIRIHMLMQPLSLKANNSWEKFSYPKASKQHFALTFCSYADVSFTDGEYNTATGCCVNISVTQSDSNLDVQNICQVLSKMINSTLKRNFLPTFSWFLRKLNYIRGLQRRQSESSKLNRAIYFPT